MQTAKSQRSAGDISRRVATAAGKIRNASSTSCSVLSLPKVINTLPLANPWSRPKAARTGDTRNARPRQLEPLARATLRTCDFMFTVGSEDLSTYMDVTEPSMTIIQERPPFTDIVNGIGLFSARTVKSVDSLLFSTFTLDEIKTNQYTKKLGF